MAKPRRPAVQRARPITVDDMRFVSGWRHLADIGEPAPPVAAPSMGSLVGPPIVIDVVRPADLLACSIEAYGCELLSGTEPVLRPKQGATARLVVRLSFQHVAEAAIYEGLAPVPRDSVLPSLPAGSGQKAAVPDPVNAADGEDARPAPPIAMRPARGTRLVFAVPEGERIVF